MAGSRALGDVLRRRMEEKGGMTQEQVATAVERSQSWVSRVLSGEITIGDPDLETWAALLGATPEELWEEAGGRPVRPSAARDAIAELLRVVLLDQKGSKSLENGVLLGYINSPAKDMTRNVIAVQVATESLAPTIQPNDQVLIDRDQRGVDDSMVVVAGKEDLLIGWRKTRDGNTYLTSNASFDIAIDRKLIEGVVFKVVRDVPFRRVYDRP